MAIIVRNKETKEVLERFEEVLDFSSGSITVQAGKGRMMRAYNTEEVEIIDEAVEQSQQEQEVTE